MNKIIQEQRNEVTQYLLNKIQEDGKLPWRDGLKINLQQHNPLTNTQYKGANILRLYVSSLKNEFTDPRWVTFNQVKKANESIQNPEERLKIKAGSKGTQIEYWNTIEKGTKEWDDYTKNWSKEKKEKQGDITIGKYYTVFNAEQIENFPELVKEQLLSKEQQSKELDTIIANSEAPIEFNTSGRNSYVPSQDMIHLTDRKYFESDNQFYGTAIHEIAHSTGHTSRLNRDLTGTFGSESYAKEELYAEFTAALLTNRYELAPSKDQLDNHAAYLKSWASVIEKDPNIFFKAIQEAERIENYIETHMLHKELEQTHSVTSPTISARVDWIEGGSYAPPTEKEAHIFLGGSEHAFPYCSPSTAVLRAMVNNERYALYDINKNLLQANEYIIGKEYTGQELHQLFNDLYIDDTLNGANSYGCDKCDVVITITDATGQTLEVPLRADIGYGDNFTLDTNTPTPLQSVIDRLKNDPDIPDTFKNALQEYNSTIQEKVNNKEYALPSLEDKTIAYQLAKLNVATDLGDTPKWNEYPKENLKQIFTELKEGKPITEILDNANIRGLHNISGNDLKTAINEINGHYINEDILARTLHQAAAANILNVYKDDEISPSFKEQLEIAGNTLATSNYKYKQRYMSNLNNVKNISQHDITREHTNSAETTKKQDVPSLTTYLQEHPTIRTNEDYNQLGDTLKQHNINLAKITKGFNQENVLYDVFLEDPANKKVVYIYNNESDITLTNTQLKGALDKLGKTNEINDTWEHQKKKQNGTTKTKPTLSFSKPKESKGLER